MKKLLKQFINNKVLDYVKNNKELENNIVAQWSNGAEIATYNIDNSEVTLENINMIYSSITGCRINEVKSSVFKNSPITLIYDEKPLDNKTE
jgi:hypothetical protein